MKLSMSGLWQLSPLTDLTIPQDDLSFPGPLSQCLPDDLSEQEIAAQEWHLMHDVEVDERLLDHSTVDLVIAGIEHYAEVRLNGFSLFDCNKDQQIYRKNVRPFLQAGLNRFEILFLEDEEDFLLEDEDSDSHAQSLPELSSLVSENKMGIWKEPYLQSLNHVRLTDITVEQIWHYGGGCEVLFNLHFDVLKPGLISARIKFDGLVYTVPLDMMNSEASALFQLDAPVICEGEERCSECIYTIDIELDGIQHQIDLPLSIDNGISHFSV